MTYEIRQQDNCFCAVAVCRCSEKVLARSQDRSKVERFLQRRKANRS